MSQKFNIGTTVRVVALPTYLKTADPMPTLRSPNLLELGTIGCIIDRKPGNYWVVKFDRHAFLLEEQYLEAIDDCITLESTDK
ncbi:regulatory protein SipA [Chamaesiphon sp. VAR_48_metabat_403]|uniref:regulatory protein SipA n=1 Tax=Chamaesiphon sp. VAR_48_metabat_403 TaxID=2964700 RepID=UPI00286E56C4|nr:DUF3148 domain-containing protein [Chamaesiphon sp. VAR_48_metabat_403]